MKKKPPSQSDIVSENQRLIAENEKLVEENARLKTHVSNKAIEDIAEANRVMLRNKKRHG